MNPTDPNDGRKTDPTTVQVTVGYGLNPTPNVTFNIAASLKWSDFSTGNRELSGSETSEYSGPCDRNWSKRCNNPPVNVKAQHYAEAKVKFGGDSSNPSDGDASATAEVTAKSTDFDVR